MRIIAFALTLLFLHSAPVAADQNDFFEGPSMGDNSAATPRPKVKKAQGTPSFCMCYMIARDPLTDLRKAYISIQSEVASGTSCGPLILQYVTFMKKFYDIKTIGTRACVSDSSVGITSTYMHLWDRFQCKSGDNCPRISFCGFGNPFCEQGTVWIDQ